MLFIPSWRKSQFGPCVRHWKVSGQHKDLSENLFSESDLKRQVWSLVTVTVWAIMVSKRMQKQRRSATSLNVAICTTKFAKHVWRRNPLAKTMTACLLTRISTQTLLIFWRNWITGTTWFHLHGSALGNPCQDTILELASGTQCTQFFLGTAKEFLASCLGYWSRRGCLTGPDLQEQLRWVSQRQKECCAEAGLRCTFKTFTPSNTGLVTKSEYPELGSYFKAASVKTSIWFFGYLAQELAANAAEDKHWGNQTCFGKQFGLWFLKVFSTMYSFDLDKLFWGKVFTHRLNTEDFMMHLIAVSLWGLQSALVVLDNCDIILGAHDAEVGAYIYI